MSELTDQLRLLLVDNHALFRTSLARLLAAENGFEIAGECGSASEALDVLRGTPVDVVLLDFDIGGDQGNAFILNARRGGFDGQFLLITGTADIDRYALALTLGASGVFLKSDRPDRLVRAIRLVASGGIWIDPTVVQRFAERYMSEDHGRETVVHSLEDREEAVLEGLLQGLTNKRIGMQIGLSESSVKNILQGLFGKTGVRTRSQLVRAALEGSLGRIPSLIARQSGG